jgi:DNA (cytosine-5)-methyltransferase 1
VTEDVCYTLNTIDRPAVVFQTYQKVTGPLMANSHPGSYTGQDAFSDMLVAGKTNVFRQGGFAEYIEGEIGTLRASGGDYGGGTENILVEQNVRYIVRRLTPTECARLQGFADKWAHPIWIDENTKGEVAEFWREVYLTDCAIKAKKPKPRIADKQNGWEIAIIRWYNGLHTDSSEYKLWGNGIALPCAMYVMQGIADAINQ